MGKWLISVKNSKNSLIFANFGCFEGNGYQDRKKGKRDIYALCRKWDDSEFLVWNSFDANKSKPKKERVVIEYKYGPLTSQRRGEAMKMRKEILEEKAYKNAYVKFPALLMARKDYQKFQQYKCI